MDKSEQFSRQAAYLLGKGVQKTSNMVVDRADDVVLVMLQGIAALSKGRARNERLSAQLGAAAVGIRRASHILPPLAGRLVAVSTYFGLRASLRLVHQVDLALAARARDIGL